MPTWSTSPLPVRPGFYMNFLAAATAAISQGVQGITAVIGTGDWGPTSQAVAVTSQGAADSTYWAASAGTVHQAAIDALDGFDQTGAGLCIALRVASASASAGVLTLNDGSASGALQLTARYSGARANSWTVNVQTNALNPANKDLYLLESGVVISAYTNVGGAAIAYLAGAPPTFPAATFAVNSTVGFPSSGQVTIAGVGTVTYTSIVGSTFTGCTGGTGTPANGTPVYLVGGGTNVAFASVMANDPYVIATAIPPQGPGNRQLANITGVIGGAGGFTGGTSGLSPVATDYVNALNLIGQQAFDTVTIAGVQDQPTQSLFVSWLANLNSNVRRAFGVIGGPLQEGMSAAVQRSQLYNNRDLINVGATDLVQLGANTTLPPYQLVSKVAGAIAGIGFSRAATNMTLTGYQVMELNLANSDYANADNLGVFCFANSNTTQVRVESGVTTFSNPNLTGPNPDPPTAHLKIRNVAIDHFVSNTMTTQAQQSDLGIIANNTAGQNAVITQILNLCKSLETAQALQPGASTVTLDTVNPSVGTAMFIDVAYQYVGIAERFFVKTAVK